MTPTKNTPNRSKQLSIYLVINFLIVAFMLAAVPLIRSGQSAYLPHADVDKNFVVTAIASEHPERIEDALKSTEIYRATGYQSIVGMMDVMQMGAIVLALLFALNGFILFRLRQQHRELVELQSVVATPAHS